MEISKNIVSKFIDFINDFEGTAIRMKEIHWHTTSTEVHQATDSIYYHLHDMLDNVVEQFIGLTDRSVFPDGFFRPTPYFEDYSELLENLKTTSGRFKKFIESCDIEELSGISSRIDNFIENTLVNSYRSPMI